MRPSDRTWTLVKRSQMAARGWWMELITMRCCLHASTLAEGTGYKATTEWSLSIKTTPSTLFPSSAVPQGACKVDGRDSVP